MYVGVLPKLALQDLLVDFYFNIFSSLLTQLSALSACKPTMQRTRRHISRCG